MEKIDIFSGQILICTSNNTSHMYIHIFCEYIAVGQSTMCYKTFKSHSHEPDIHCSTFKNEWNVFDLYIIAHNRFAGITNSTSG